ncbi:NADPH-dependent dioxygenase [Amycolatopsis xylanica]|uniref:NADPH-dependent dioxygenase n=1 Tax=Amycolatopsis xylanica TaxID=589385 RepID=A0A1H2VTK7_9PSEU|nr:FAD-dependent oxidoreductase [Amycolatopsis xylanica]SDW71606.1 NADPH-dependent dioxygenase [Amycolatopsis xylanica]
MDGSPAVLVVGAGPVGLTAAHELLRRDIEVRVIDRADGPAVTSRATATHARALEVYHQMGLLDEVLERGQRVDGFTVHRLGRALTRLGTNFSALPTRFPFTLQVDQVITEEILRARLAKSGVEVEWGVALEDLSGHADRADVRLRHADGTAEELSVPWLIGADGAHSVVRDRLGLRLAGESSETWLIADAIVDADLPRDSLHWMHTGQGTIMLVPFPAPGKWRLLDTVDVDGADDPDAIAARFAAKITAGLGKPATVRTPSWVSVFTIRQRMVERMRVGRCFVAGDAAHVHSPASGQGMNTGVQDAHNLAWKLADVIRGHADEALLDSYSAERVPIGEALLGSTKTATRLVALREAAVSALLPVGTTLLNGLGGVKRRVEGKVQKVMSGLALNYVDSQLTVPSGAPGAIAPGDRVGCDGETERTSAGWRAMCAEFTDPRWTLLACAEDELLETVGRGYGQAVSVRSVSALGDRGPGALADPGGTLRAELGLQDGQYALIRPDGYLAAKGPLGELTATLGRLHLIDRAVA